MSTLYSNTAIEKLYEKYIEEGGTITTLQEGTLGWGLTVMYGEGLKFAVVTEVYLNEWSSAHKIRMYNSPPKKYLKMIEEWEEEELKREEEWEVRRWERERERNQTSPLEKELVKR